MGFRILQTKEFKEWFSRQPEKTQLIIAARLERLQCEGHWGFINKFDGLIELKWKSGVRVYTAIYEQINVLVLLGGNKNGQGKDIKKAKRIFSKINY